MTRTRAFVIMGLITVVADSVFAGAHIVNLEPDTAKRRAIVIYRSKSTETLYLYAPTPWVIGSSHIVAQDTNLWHPLNTSPNNYCHIYNLVNASPGQEYVAVYGNLTQDGTGFGYSPWFRATVPSVDIDWDGYGAPGDEDGEDAREVFCPVTTNNAARRKILIRQPKDDTSLVTPPTTLSWWPASMRVLKKENNGTLTQLSNGTTINHTPSTVWPVTLYADPTTQASIEILLQGLADENGSRTRDVIEGRSFVEGELKSVEFTSDHNLLKKNPTSGSEWGDSSDAYETPEWVADTRNNPISQTKNTKLTAKVKLKVEPAGATFELFGNGFDGYANFRKTGNLSTGSDQEITVTADDVLPNTVGKVNKIIDWKITVGTTEYDIGSSGEHIVYVTYGTPSGSIPTDYRVSWSCRRCTGKVGMDDIVLAAHGYINENDPPYFDVGTDEWPSVHRLFGCFLILRVLAVSVLRTQTC